MGYDDRELAHSAAYSPKAQKPAWLTNDKGFYRFFF